MKKILFIGDLNTYGRSFRRFKTLKLLSYDVTAISHSIVSSNQKIQTPSILYRIFNKLMLPLDLTDVNEKTLYQVKKKIFNVIWIENGTMIFPSTLKYIKRYYPNIKIVSLSEDDMCKKHNQSFWYLLGLKYYDFVFTTKKHNLKCLTKLGAKKISLFFDSFDGTIHKIYKKTDQNRYKFSVSHIGAYEKERSEYLFFLAKNGIKVEIWGNDWNKCPFKHDNLKIHYSFLYKEKYSKTIYKSKINLNFLRKINDDVITSRSLEIPASGGFMLAERTEAQKKIFKENVEADYFSSKEELLRKTKFYLNNENVRKKIETKGYNKCIKSNYSMSAQMSLILKKIF